MSIALYDDALVQKFSAWTKDSNLQIYSPNEVSRLFEVEIDEGNDKPIKLPLIAISRAGGYSILNQGKRPLSFDGLTINANIEKSIQLNAIPISITYQIDVYTRYLKEADEITRNLVFNIINYPKLPVTFKYNNYPYTHNSNIRLSDTIDDNSSIPERLSLGQFSRLTLSITVDDAYLWDTRVRNNVFLVAEIDESGGKSLTSKEVETQ